MSKLTSWIATTGTNPNFIAFNAHSGFAFSVLAFLPSWWTVAALAVGCAVKEFWFDATYEQPKQTFTDNATDYAGYMTGVLLGALKFL